MTAALSTSPLRLHLNENTAGCSPRVWAAIQSLTPADVARYPDVDAVTARCAAWFGVAPAQVLLTNGLDDGIFAVARRARELHASRSAAPFDVITVEPAFEMYSAAAEGLGATVTRVAPAGDFIFPVEAVLGAVSDRTRLVFLNDPNNPTGRSIASDDVERVAWEAPDAIVLVDEAYADYRGRTAVGPLLPRHRNLIVGRTFSKAFGLAGLRIGALIGAADVIESLRLRQPPFGVNAMAIRALDAALDDRPFYEASVADAAAARQLIYDWCERRRLSYWRSEGNFVLVRVGPRASRLVVEAAARGVLLRDKSAAAGCAGCVRISAGCAADTRRGLAILETIDAARAS